MSGGSAPFGDMDPERFRAEAHRVVDWIADYLAGSDRYPVLSRVRPARSRQRFPERSTRRRTVRRDLRRFRARDHARHHALEPPGLLRLLRDHRQRARRARGVHLGGAQRAGDAVAHVAGGDRARGGDAGLAAPADRAARHVRGGHLRHRVGLHPARARRRARGARPDVRNCGLRGPTRRAAAARLLLRPDALLDRQGRHRCSASATSRCARSPSDARVPHAPGRAARGHREDRAAGSAADRGRGDRRHDVVDERRSGRGDRRDLRSRVGCGCTSTRRTRGVAAMVPEYAPHSARRGARRLARREPAQVAVHAVRPERVLLPPHGRRARGVLARARVPEDAARPRRCAT